MASENSEQIQKIGPYEVESPPEKGGMGDVYQGVDPSTGKKVAVKVLSPTAFRDEERAADFEKEIEALLELRHANVVRILDHGREGERHYFVMEHVRGSSLAELLRRRRLTLRDAITVFRGICQGLNAAHEKKIIHGNLNPSHILISDDLSVVKVADFGLSRPLALTSEMGTLATSEVSLGSIQYLAPEKSKSGREPDARSDIYSAGVILYEMLTGRVPVGRFSLPSQINPEIPPEVDPIVLKCLSTQPDRRYGSPALLLRAVTALEDKLRMGLVDELRGFSRSTSKILLRSTSPLKQRWLWIGLAAFALIAAAILAATLLFRGPDAAAPAAPGDELPALAPAPAPEEPRPGPEGPEGVETGETATGEASGVETPLVAPEPPAVEEEPVEKAPAAPAPAAPPRPAPAATPKPDPAAAARRDFQAARGKAEAGLSRQALDDLGAFVGAYPTSPLGLDAYLLMAQIHEREGRTAEAMGALVEIGSRYASDPRAADAQLKLARMTLARGRGSELAALTIFSQVAEKYPDSRRAPEALAAMAEIERDQKIKERDALLGASVPAELVTYRRLAERYPEHPAAEKALWELGRLYDQLERYELAARSYSDLGTRFPSTVHDAWWEAGQLYEKRLRDEARARAAYQKVPRSSSQYGAAQRRLRKLD